MMLMSTRGEALDQAQKAYREAMAQARKVFDEATARAEELPE
jgi:hypothetical protein